TGTENYGGPVVTAGGLVFIAATRDNKFRAFNKATGKLLWEYNLPASGFATPAVYELNGKQYVVIACGGGKLGTKPGDAYLAFALP
ncbi:MAG TPA: pyrrolo-quinoline quinone, partial [Cytophagales bacterium]|nr:pyrrolo-quinoline quinone [Cytophagales bacterium]